jgi:molybdenum cofactor cytidylyltransferase
MMWAIVLAAGESRRMGEPKLLLPFGGKTVIEAVLESVKASRVERILVVVGAGAAPIEEKAKKHGALVAMNPDYRSGMLSSVQCGFQQLPLEAEAALVFLADQPAIKPSVADALVKAFKDTSRGIIIPVFDRRRGHPVLISAQYRTEIRLLDREVGLRQLLARHPQDILEVSVDDPAILRDLDTPEDYRQEAMVKELLVKGPKG